MVTIARDSCGGGSVDCHGSFGILYVCTGNICRSPFAEILTRHLLVGKLGGNAASLFDVSSAGVHAVVGARMHDDTRDELMPWGLDGAIAGRFRSRQLHLDHIENADLVLGASPGHRAAVVSIAPSALPATFSILEFARLVRSLDLSEIGAVHPVDRAHALVEHARMQKGFAVARPDSDSIPDPVGRPPAIHRDVADLVHDAVTTVVAAIAGPRSQPRPA